MSNVGGDVKLNNVDRVSWVVGRPAAEELDKQGLIRHDAWSAPKPTHYVLKVTPGKGPYNHNTWLRTEIEDVYNTITNRARYRYGGQKSVAHVELEYKRKGSAESMAKKARACGLDAEVVPCILMPVNKIG